MKLGISYNLFDGEELLEDSIKQIRHFVDHVSVVYQDVSNFGNKSKINLKLFLKDLRLKKLVDEVSLYIPQNIGPRQNELSKRNRGLEIAKLNKCTHYMSMDTDEYYVKEEFYRLIEDVKENKWDSTFCNMKTYYKSWEYQITPPEDYFVPLIYKIYDDKIFNLAEDFPVLVDPTRKFNLGRYKAYERSFIEMHHGSYIRNDISSKVENSTSRDIISSDTHRKNIILHYSRWRYPEQALFIGREYRYYDVIKVKNIFK